MALSERSRHQIYDYLSTTELGEEAISEMLSYFPARDVDEPITRGYLTGELALIRLEMAELRSELRSELRGEINGLDAKINGLDAKVTGLDAKVNWLASKTDGLAADMIELKGFVHSAMREQLSWLIGTQIAVIAIIVAIAGIAAGTL